MHFVRHWGWWGIRPGPATSVASTCGAKLPYPAAPDGNAPDRAVADERAAHPAMPPPGVRGGGDKLRAPRARAVPGQAHPGGPADPSEADREAGNGSIVEPGAQVGRWDRRAARWIGALIVVYAVLVVGPPL